MWGKIAFQGSGLVHYYLPKYYIKCSISFYSGSTPHRGRIYGMHHLYPWRTAAFHLSTTTWNLPNTIKMPRCIVNITCITQSYFFFSSHPSPTVMRFREHESAPQVKLQPYEGDIILGSGLPSNDTQVLIRSPFPCPVFPLACLSREFQLQSLRGNIRMSGSNTCTCTCTVPADLTT